MLLRLTLVCNPGILVYKQPNFLRNMVKQQNQVFENDDYEYEER